MSNDIKLPPLPEADSSMTIIVAGCAAEIDTFRASTMDAYARAAVEADRRERREVALPDGWRIVEKKTCYTLLNGNEVVATLAGPDAHDNAAIIAHALAAPVTAQAQPATIKESLKVAVPVVSQQLTTDERDRLMRTIAECRDLLPPPAVGSPLEGLWAGAMSDPHSTPAYLRAALAQDSGQEKVPANSGHGHVFPRPDGVKARCGGPGLCPECSRDAARAAKGVDHD